MNLFKKPAPRLEPLPPNPGLDDVFSRFNCVGSIIPNAILIMQRRPKILRAYVQMMGAVTDPETSEVDVGFKRLIAHVTSRAADCRYCMTHTVGLAHCSGVDNAKIEAVWEYRTSPLYTEAERIALDVALAAGGVPNGVRGHRRDVREAARTLERRPDRRDRGDDRTVRVPQSLERHACDAARGRGARARREVPRAPRLGGWQAFEKSMIIGRFNIVLGLVAMILAASTGFALGLTRDAYFQNGYEQITYWRSLTMVGHTHGMPFGMINILFGLLIGRAACSSRFKRYGAVFTASALCLPLGVALRGGLLRVRCGRRASPCLEAPRSYLLASS